MAQTARRRRVGRQESFMIRCVSMWVAAIALTGVGCANRPQSPQAPPSASAFEKMKDPPINARTYFAAGQLAESQGQFPEAIRQYQNALNAQRKYLDAMFRMGVVYAQMRDYPHAIETWNRYIQVSGGSATAYSNLGFCQELAGNPAAAETAYRQGIRRDPNNEPCHVNFGLMLARHGHPTEALAQLRAVLPPAKAHYDLASVYELDGQKAAARDEYRQALQFDPTLEDAKAKLATMGE